VRVGAYTVIKEIARGGMGVVYQARDGAGRDVAIKVLLGGATADEVRLKRFQREAEALARLKHPNVVKVHTTGDHEGIPYLAMDFVPGGTLAGRLATEGPLGTRESAEIACKLAGALAHCHEHAVIHRDVKPENVLWSAGAPLLTDFGLAKDVDANSALTRTGLFMGSPGYLAPEQARGETAGPAADVFGLGATLYALLTGCPPYEGESLIEILVKMSNSDPTPPGSLRTDLEPDLEAVCVRCLRSDPAERYASAQSLADDLARFLAGDAVAARERSGERALRWVAKRRAFLGTTLVGALLVGGSWVAAGTLDMPDKAPSSVVSVPEFPAKPTRLPDAQVKAKLAKARVHLRNHEFHEGLKELAALPEPPPRLVWELNQRQALRSLNSGNVAKALACLDEDASKRGLSHVGPAVQDARHELAKQAVANATSHIKGPLVGLEPDVLREMSAQLQLARALLPAQRVIHRAQLQDLTSLAQMVGIVSQRDRNTLYVDVVVRSVDLNPEDPALLEELSALAARSRIITEEDARRVVPYAKRLAAMTNDDTERVGVCRLLFRASAHEEALALSATLLAKKTLDRVSRINLLERSATLYAKQERWQLALSTIERARANSPLDPDLRLRLIDILRGMGRREDALEQARELVQSTNWGDGAGGAVVQERPFREALGQIWLLGGRAGCPDVARKGIERLLGSLSPKDSVVWWLRLAILEFDRGAVAQANVPIALATQEIRTGPYAHLLADLLAELREASAGRRRKTGDVVADLLKHYERVASRGEFLRREKERKRR
jgi:tetratricopeptide (TPR) repeat protein